MFNYTERFSDLVCALKREGRYRVFRVINRQVGKFPRVRWVTEEGEREITVWCSNDYLGMGHHPVVLRAAQEAIAEFGAGAGGTRNIAGTHEPIVRLEAELASAVGKEAALVFSSGYAANETGLTTLARALPECVILSDEANHASMIEGMKLGRAEKKIFRHNDLDHLEALLAEIPANRPRIVAFESVYSMEGDASPIGRVCALAKRYGALTYLDETHAVGLYGRRGGGLAQELGVTDQLDIIQGGLGKGYGVVGGFLAGSSLLIDMIRSYGSGFIFTTALPPAVAAAARASVAWLSESSAERTAHREAVAKTKAALRAGSISFRDGGTHIIPVMIGDSVVCKDIADYLLSERDVYLQPINYPTVPRGTERLRVTPSPHHDAEMIRELSLSLRHALHKFEIRECA